jgi:hypothetical protein
MKDLSNFGINSEFLPVNLFNKLKEQIDLLKGKIGQQHRLAGNIKEEWSIQEAIPLFESYIISLINKHQFHLNYLSEESKKFINYNKTPPLKLINFWVNFQKKYEFNPVHNHSGLFSFVIFVKIPYDLKEELKNSPGSLSNSNYASCLQFHVTSLLGRHYDEVVYVDKSYEGGVYFFNAETKHCVYPFFTSDDYRITVSGNLGWVY